MAVKKRYGNALGRGLDALISTDDVRPQGSSTINEIPLEQIEANPNQPRREFDPTALQELANSIREIGIIQPITLRQIEVNRFQIIAGERRWRASQMAGLRAIPAYIRTINDENIMEMALVENIQREDLNAISSKRIAKFRNQSIGFVFQFFYLQPHMTIAENLTVPMMPMRIPRNLRQQRIQTAAATVNIVDKLNSYPKSLSGGELQRAAIARAIINQPKLILADEATGNLDDNNTMNIVRLLLDIKQQSHTTIVMVTHDMRIAQMADRTLYLKNGSISYAQN